MEASTMAQMGSVLTTTRGGNGHIMRFRVSLKHASMLACDERQTLSSASVSANE